LAIKFGDQSHFTIAVAEKPLDDFVGNRQRRHASMTAAG